MQSIAGLVLDVQFQVGEIDAEDVASGSRKLKIRVEARLGFPIVDSLVSGTAREVFLVEVVAGAVDVIDSLFALSRDGAGKCRGGNEEGLEMHAQALG